MLRRLLQALRGLGLWQNPSLTQQASAGFDSSLVLVGSSPFGTPFDSSSSFLEVPAVPSAPGNRYLFRLCSYAVPPGKSARIVAIGQYTEIAALVPDTVRGGVYPVRREVLTPGWAFTDGNEARGLTTRKTPDSPPLVRDPGQLPSTTPNLYGFTPALIYQPAPGGGPVPYTAPGGGRWPGKIVQGLGLWRDKRFPWVLSGASLDYSIDGGCTVDYWASVKQTDPATRPQLTGTIDDPGALGPEDRTVLQFPGTQYSRIGGYMVLEVGPSNRSNWRMSPEVFDSFLSGLSGTEEEK